MSRKEKLVNRLLSRPRDFTFSEAETLLRYFGYVRENAAGSRVRFDSEEFAPILLRKPHPRRELLEYQVEQLIEHLRNEGLIG